VTTACQSYSINQTGFLQPQHGVHSYQLQAVATTLKEV
jgi:hypothetical protein